MTTASPDIVLLDCTLRDGSYQVEFGFTAVETSKLVRELERAGIDWIEVGHGLGLGAPASGRVKFAENDSAYIKAAKSSAQKAKIGVFAMPAFAAVDDLTRAVDLGIDFLRFGVDAARFSQAEPFIRHAARLGVHVTIFLMKSYTLRVDELSQSAVRFADWGAQAIAIVDSAGGMTPPIVRDYVAATRQTTGLTVAFHGHNNLQLAVGNAIAAAEAGATVLDASLHGLGRSAGNAQIEALAVALARCGYRTTCNAIELAHIADRFIADLTANHPSLHSKPTRDSRRVGVEIVELFQGLSFVHSGMQPLIDRVATEMNIDAYRLTIAVGELAGGLNVEEVKVRDIAKRLSARD